MLFIVTITSYFIKLKKTIEEALQLNLQERFIIVETLLKSLDKSDETLENIWADEAEKRLMSYHKGEVQTIPFDEVFK